MGHISYFFPNKKGKLKFHVVYQDTISGTLSARNFYMLFKASFCFRKVIVKKEQCPLSIKQLSKLKVIFNFKNDFVYDENHFETLIAVWNNMYNIVQLKLRFAVESAVHLSVFGLPTYVNCFFPPSAILGIFPLNRSAKRIMAGKNLSSHSPYIKVGLKATAFKWSEKTQERKTSINDEYLLHRSSLWHWHCLCSFSFLLTFTILRMERIFK